MSFGQSKVIPKIDPHLIPKTHLEKASWESLNEGVHERVNFDDTIWGFDLAGGSRYGIPLRVMRVKPNSRADKAGIRKGDKLKRINDIQTETLTLQEAHDMIVESGIYIRLAVTAPEDTDTTFNIFQDEYDSYATAEAERIRQEELAKKRKIVCKTNSHWNLMWPWTTRKTYIYRESNCFQVPSAYEVKFPEKIKPKEVEAKKIVLLPSEEIEKRSNPPTPEVKENGPPKLDGKQEKISTTPIAEGQEPEESAIEQKFEGILENNAATPVTEAKETKENMLTQPQMNGFQENGQAPEKPVVQPETKEILEKKEEEQSENIAEHNLTSETEKDYDKLVADLLEEERIEAKENRLAAELTDEQESKTNGYEAESNEVEEDDGETEHEAIENGLDDEPADDNEDLTEEGAPEKDGPETEENLIDAEGGEANEPENVEPQTENKKAETEEEDESVKNGPQPDTAETLPED